MSDSTPVLYSFRRCPYAMRARLAIYSSELAVELREILLRDKPASMLEASPKGTVPVLVLPDGEVIDESFDVILHALGISDPMGLLMPQKASLEEAKTLIKKNDGDFKTNLDHYKYPNRYENIDRETARADAAEFLMELERLLSENGPHLYGDSLSIADIAILPFVRQFANVDFEWFSDQPWPKLKVALDQFVNSELFLSIMEKYPAWSEGDEPTHFGRLERA